MANKKPRRVELNNNLTRYNAKSIEVQSYPENFEGLIASFADRYSAKKEAIEERLKEFRKTTDFLRVPNL